MGETENPEENDNIKDEDVKDEEKPDEEESKSKLSNKRSRRTDTSGKPQISNQELMRQCEEAAGCALSKKEKRKIKVQLRLQEKAKLFRPTSNVTSAGVKYTTTETGGFILSKAKKGLLKIQPFNCTNF